MKRLGILVTLLLVVGAASTTNADHRSHRVRAELSGYNEVLLATTLVCASTGQPPLTTPPPPPPCPGAGGAEVPVVRAVALRGAFSTEGKGRFRAKISKDVEEIEYDLSWEDLEGTVTQAHIHFGQPFTIGGIVVWLCQTPTTAPAPASVASITPECPAGNSGEVSGIIRAANVLEAAGQGIAATEFDELVRAIRAGATYANVHSSLSPAGEIRGHIHDGVIGKVLNFHGHGHDH